MRRVFALLPLLLFLAACASSPALRFGVVPAADGIPLAFDHGGQGAPAIVFVHGWCCDRSLWAEQLAVFAADHRVVALDLGGHGESGDGRTRWDLDVLARDVVTVVEELDLERVVLVGHSMGGPVAVLAAAEVPERVVGVVAVDALHDADFVWPEEMWEEWKASMEADFDAYIEGFVGAMFLHDPESDVAARVRAVMSAAKPSVALPLMRAMYDFDAKASLAACPVPIRCINSGDGFPTNVEGNRKYAPSFDAVTMDGVGHFLHLENPAEFNALLRAAISEYHDR